MNHQLNSKYLRRRITSVKNDSLDDDSRASFIKKYLRQNFSFLSFKNIWKYNVSHQAVKFIEKN